jgi:DNA-directed RNA polymerase specialized sigma24 family protein
MGEEKTSSRNDPLLLPYLLTPDEAESGRLLGDLVSEHAEPVVVQIIRAKLRFHSDHKDAVSTHLDAEDACSDVYVRLLERLKECRISPIDKAIGNFRSYVAVTTYHVCYQYLRAKYPQRQSLKDKLRYLLTHQPGLALWGSEDATLHCGFAAWRDRKNDWLRDDRLGRLLDDPNKVMQAVLQRADFQRMNPADLFAAVFNQVGHPIELDDLVTVIASLWGIQDRQRHHAASDEVEDPFAGIADYRVNLAKEAEQRDFLKWLWAEIALLPLRQRWALLLNLKDENGGGVLALLPLTGVASIRQIAALLEMQPERLAELWPDLPLEDTAIARLLDITRQQVINLRKCARERLGRRIRGPAERK